MPRAMARLMPLVPVIALFALASASLEQSDLDAGLELFGENKIEEALPLLERAASQDSRNAEALAWLAEAHRRLGHKDEALKRAEQSLELQPRNSFAHLVIAEALFPYGGAPADYDTVWYHIDRAVECDSTDGNAWQMMWAEAVFKGDLPLLHRVVRKMVETGFLTGAALAYGRWELQGLPADALLLTNGDMDTFPAQAVQVTEGFRPDVAVVEWGLLGTPTGRRFVRDKLGVPMPFAAAELDSLGQATDAAGNVRTASDRVFAGWIARRASGAFTRPLALAPTVEKASYQQYQDQFLNAGAFLIWQPAPVTAPMDTAAVRLSLGSISPDDFRGPWVGPRDRSPVRRVYTKFLARIITSSALAYAEELTEAGSLVEAGDILTWAEGFERRTELGPTFTEEIEEMRAELRSRALQPAARPQAPAICIHYVGHSSFVFAFDNGVTLLTDYGQSNAYGLDSPVYDLGNLQPTVVAYSHHHDDHDRGTAFPGATVLDGSDLSLQGIAVKAIPVSERGQGDNYGYLITFRGMTFFFAGDSQGDMVAISDEAARSRVREHLPPRLDVLLAPIGWMRPITEDAVAYVNFLEPRVVIPMHYWSADEKTGFLNVLGSGGKNYVIADQAGPTWNVAIPRTASSIQVISLTAGPYGD